MTYSQSQARERLIELNDHFQSRQLGDPRIHDALELQDCDLQKSILFEAFPDSGETWILRLMDQNGFLVQYDLDVADPSNTRAEEYPKSHFKKKQGQCELDLIKELHGKLQSGT